MTPRLTALCLVLVATAVRADEPPFGIDQRVLFTTSRVVGSPEPPLPFRARRAFPQLNFHHSLHLIREPGSERLLVVEQGGKVLGFPNNPAVDKTEVFCQVKDHDTYSITFHPDYLKNGFVYVFSNGPNSQKKKKNRILRYHVPRDGANRACDPASELLIIDWESNGHNGGDLAFGPDRFLYITSGDGTSDSDGDHTGQDVRDLASGIVRIDVERPAEGKNYSVPADNPFLTVKDARPELWAFGFRNPWRLSFDQAGNLWVSDVGQDLWEMIYLVRRGGNYGWSVHEGNHPFQLQRPRGPAPILPPLIEHPHSEARSITGGFVYQGQRFKELQGAYVYGDYSTGKIWGARQTNGKVTWQKELANTTLQIVGFGQDSRGELYIVDYLGQIHELEPIPVDIPQPPFPRKLSETGLFASVAGHRPAPGLIPYSVNAPLWSDGAYKERFLGLPGDTSIGFTEQGAWRLPEATVLVKTFALDLEVGKSAVRRRIETRLLTLQQGQWYGYSYLWNEAQTDAELVPAAGLDRVYAVHDPKAPEGVRKQSWHYPSRAECMVCHTRAAGFVLGVNTLQLNKVHDYGTVADNQLRTLEHLGVFRNNSVEQVRLFEARVRQWLTPVRALVEPYRAVLAPVLPGWPGGWTKAWSRGVTELERRSRVSERLAKRPADFPKLADPYDPNASLEARARAYLHANCAQCHVQAGGGNAAIDLHIKTALPAMKALDVAPLHDHFGIRDARVIAPGEPERSLIYQRLTRLAPGRMPPLSSSVVDEQAARMLAEWIRQLPKEPAKK